MFVGKRKKQTENTLCLGLDVGSSKAKTILAENVGSRIDIHGAGCFDVGAGMIVSGRVAHPKALGKLIAQEVATYPRKPTGAVISIPSNLATLRWVTLPDLPSSERREAARFKVKRHLPFPVEDAYIDATAPVFGSDSAEGQSLVIAVPREIVDSRAAAIEAAGIQPLGAELEAQSILRVIERRLASRGALWRDASMTIIDVGGSFTHMYVVQNQRLQFIRGVKFGADIFTEALVDGLGVSRDHAGHLLSNPSTKMSTNGMLAISADEEMMIANVQSAMEKLTREFLRLLRYFRSLHPERSYAGILDHVVVCGGLVGLQGFAEYLEEVLGLRVERARPFENTVAQLKKETFQSVSMRQEAYTVVMGLALAGLKGSLSTGKEIDDGNEFIWKRAA